MRNLMILVFGGLLFLNCTTAETKTSADPEVSKAQPTPARTNEQSPFLAKLNLTDEQLEILDHALPTEVRKILENAEKFEILAELDNQGESPLEPNRIVKVSEEQMKKDILEAFYLDAAAGDNPAACYIPRHKIVASDGNQTVEVEICFDCARFRVESPFGKFEGTISREDRRSEELFDRLIKNKSTEYKK